MWLLLYNLDFLLQAFLMMLYVPHIIEKVILPFFGKFEVLNSLFVGIINDLIVNIGDVHAVLNHAYDTSML
jgi:hypothetical protein